MVPLHVEAGRHSFTSDGQTLPPELQHYYDAVDENISGRPLQNEVFDLGEFLSEDPIQKQTQFERLAADVRKKWGPHVSADPESHELVVAATPLAQQEIKQFLKSLTVFESRDRAAEQSVEI